MKQERNYILIDKYLREELSSAEKIEFDVQSKDDDFLKVLEEYKNIKEAAKKSDAAEIKKMLQKMEENSSFFNPFLKKILLLLGMLLIGMVGYFCYQYYAGKSVETDQLFAEYYKAYPNTIDPLTKGEIKDSISGYKLYEMKMYREALEVWKDSEMNDDAIFFSAISNIELGEYEKAQSLLNKITITSPYSTEKVWYNGLICLKTNKGDCNQFFEKLSSSENDFYRKKALEILNKR